MEIIKWIQGWFSSQCDDDWEHYYGITIKTTDNPGWSICIDVMYTDLEKLEIPYSLFEKSDTDWYGFKIIDNKFEAFGDPSKLEFLLLKFKELIEKH